MHHSECCAIYSKHRGKEAVEEESRKSWTWQLQWLSVVAVQHMCSSWFYVLLVFLNTLIIWLSVCFWKEVEKEVLGSGFPQTNEPIINKEQHTVSKEAPAGLEFLLHDAILIQKFTKSFKTYSGTLQTLHCQMCRTQDSSISCSVQSQK